ncbi:hypothetical protein FDP41_013167 [Naegleria fowleri]|uniref:Carrier domain-containing protein n=1 Tax=Naegleria fowleri TaxID=5763 RepID=A0A6A5C2B0_NAEFO|nr:uncharacterized protein FDP41_013167 [Naegleria fowleri]KAF0980684.1 hypothetical protein FDP41_013167 [Naegleria fowleri]CAG4715459.1 unnamed protein product [Naegleria fowleri]
MFNFRHYAIAIQDYVDENQNSSSSDNNESNILSLKLGDLVLILKEFETGLGWSLVQKVDIRKVKESGCRLYDHQMISPQQQQVGFVPSAFLSTILFDPETFDPSRPLDLAIALAEDGAAYQKEIGVYFYKYEPYYRDVYQDTCYYSKQKIPTNTPKMHCLEIGQSVDEFNVGMKEWSKKSLDQWKEIADQMANRFSYPIHDIFIVRRTKHPAHLHWLVKGVYVAETINNALMSFPDRPGLGYRRKLKQGVFEQYHRWLTFSQLHERVLRFGNGLRARFNNERLVLQPRQSQDEVGRGFVGLCSINRPDWFISDWAVLTQAMVSVPLPKAKVECISDDIFNMESVNDMKSVSHEIIQIMNNSEIPVVVCSRELTVKFLKLCKNDLLPSVKAIVQMDSLLIQDFEVEEFSKHYFSEHGIFDEFLQEKRRVYQQGLKTITNYIKDQSEGVFPYYYLLKNRYPLEDSINLNVTINDLCDWSLSDDDFVFINYIDKKDFELDWKAKLLAKELGIELTDMSSIEESTFATFPTYSDELKQSIRTNKSVNDICTIVYTSGSTSTEPKGAIITDSHYNSQLQHELYQNHPLVCISFSPLSHITDRTNTTITLINGGRVGIFCGEMDRIFEDFASIQPVTLSTTPRFYNMLLAEYQNRKKKNAESADPVPEHVLFREFRHILGGRLTSMVTGGASTSPEVINFLRECFKIPVFNGYASTECGSISWVDRGEFEQTYLTDKMVQDNAQLPKHKLILEDVEIKLVDVPELNYYITDEPHARGEICVRSKSCIPGYYRDPQKTKELIDEEGYYRTGDCGEIDKKLCKVRVIDRRKNIFKLSQGEFVAPENLENLFISRTHFIDQMFIYGNSLKSFLVAVIVPKNVHILKDKVNNILRQQNLEAQDSLDYSRGCVAYKVIMEEIIAAAKEEKLEAYEIPKAFIIDPEKFTPENGKLTSSFKACRPALNKAYKQSLEDLYHQVEKESDISSIDSVQNKDELRMTLNNIFQNGGVVDSLSSVRLSNILMEKFGIYITADKILQGKNYSDPVEKIMQLIEDRANNDDLSLTNQPRFKTPSDIEAEVRNFLESVPSLHEPEVLNSMNTQILHSTPNNVLITGATGFIGVGLLCEQLMHNLNCSVYCIARGSNTADAKRRVFDNVIQYCHGLSTEYIQTIRDGFEQRCKILLGDISLPRLGLNEETWNELSTQLDSIIHCGANVNFIMNYDQLRSVNVGSVVECLKLCTAGNKLKSLHFVSSISVVPISLLHQYSNPQQAMIAEEFVPLNIENFTSLSSGYPQTKYIAEHVLRLAIEEKNISPILIYRPGLVVGHSLNGFSNVREWISRLICGIIQLGYAPQLSTEPIEMVPVDFVAKSIISIANTSELNQYLYSFDSTQRMNVFNLINTNHGNPNASLSLNDIVRHMKRMGYSYIKEVPYLSFVEILKEEMNHAERYPTMTNENSIFGILNLFPNTVQHFRTSSPLDGHLSCSNVVRALQFIAHEKQSEEIICPCMNNDQLVELYIKYFMRCGDIDPPLNN